jgi:hypothetical protein
VKKATICQVRKTKNEGLYTGYNTSKIEACEEVDENVEFCDKESQK